MILAYNFLLTLLTILLLPGIACIVLGRKKYRGKTMERLGVSTSTSKISKTLADIPDKTKVIWIHALSVGEVTSALPLVRALHKEMTNAAIVFTVATSSGRETAEKIIAPYVTAIAYSPFDFWFSVKRYIKAIRPDLCILIETDFWPNWLHLLNKNNCAVMLANGRISQQSFATYRRFRLFFLPLFRCFSLLSMQTAADGNHMIGLGIHPGKIITLGNLKYALDADNLPVCPERKELGIAPAHTILLCGSTHSGEEKLLFAAFARLAQHHPLFLIIAPRDISRAQKLVQLAASYGLKARTRSSHGSGGTVLILDTIGELASCYRLATLAFVGGSLVARGGHNPLEPAACGVAVLFGPHMEDFAEIARDLLECGGAKTITRHSLEETINTLLTTTKLQQDMAQNAKSLILRHQGCMERHLQAIGKLLNH